MDRGFDVEDTRKSDDTRGALKDEHLEPQPPSGPGGDPLDEKVLPTKKDVPKNPIAPTSPNSANYNMSHPSRGVALIFNQKKFNDRLSLGPEREGTDVDRDNLEKTVKHLGFTDDNIHTFEDLTHAELEKELNDYAGRDYSGKDCLIVCICTHGVDGCLYAKNKKFSMEELWEPFTGDQCPSLAGKPKLFFIQACQGTRYDAGVDLDVTDSGSKSFKIPMHADFLVGYSTIPGFYAWRNTKLGSWFMQSLCNVLIQKSHQTDLLSMLTLVNRDVAHNFISNAPAEPEKSNKKQIPCIISMLTRKLYFFKPQADEVDEKMD